MKPHVAFMEPSGRGVAACGPEPLHRNDLDLCSWADVRFSWFGRLGGV